MKQQHIHSTSFVLMTFLTNILPELPKGTGTGTGTAGTRTTRHTKRARQCHVQVVQLSKLSELSKLSKLSSCPVSKACQCLRFGFLSAALRPPSGCPVSLSLLVPSLPFWLRTTLAPDSTRLASLQLGAPSNHKSIKVVRFAVLRAESRSQSPRLSPSLGLSFLASLDG